VTSWALTVKGGAGVWLASSRGPRNLGWFGVANDGATGGAASRAIGLVLGTGAETAVATTWERWRRRLTDREMRAWGEEGGRNVTLRLLNA
jgi:hypothetical protein